MHFFARLAVAAATALVGQTLALPAPLVVSPGTAADIVITANNTVNATVANFAEPAATAGQFTLSLVNNLNGGAVNAYVTGLNANNQLVLLQSNNEFYLPPNTAASTPQAVGVNVAIPLNGFGQTTQVTVPAYISAARVWFAEGELQFFTVAGNGGANLVEPSAVNPSDPSANVNWGFVELTYTQAGGIFADISYVDFLGLPLGISLTCSDAASQSALGVSANAVSSVCNDLKGQTAVDGQPWGELCVQSTSGADLRVLNPTDYLSIDPSAFSNYWTDYVNQVWSFYSTNTLTIDTQAAAGEVACNVVNGELTCAGDNRGYAQPTAADIFGCNSGPFAIETGDNGVHVAVVPRLCAAFNRGTFLLFGGQVEPPQLPASVYYTIETTNYYSKFVHQLEVDGKGYAFAYDDVTATGNPSQAGVVACGEPDVLTVTIGGPSS